MADIAHRICCPETRNDSGQEWKWCQPDFNDSLSKINIAEVLRKSGRFLGDEIEETSCSKEDYDTDSNTELCKTTNCSKTRGEKIAWVQNLPHDTESNTEEDAQKESVLRGETTSILVFE